MVHTIPITNIPIGLEGTVRDGVSVKFSTSLDVFSKVYRCTGIK